MITAARQSVLAMLEESEGQECEEGIYLSCNQSLSCSRHAPPDYSFKKTKVVQRFAKISKIYNILGHIENLW